EDRTVPNTYTVTTTADSGAGSLRQAITDSNANTMMPNIIDATGVAGTITLLTELPHITQSVSINGPGSTKLTVARSGAAANFRILTMLVTGTGSVSVTGMTVTNGFDALARAATNGGDGGGISIGSGLAVTLTDVAVVNNQTASEGGGIATATYGAANLTMIN